MGTGHASEEQRKRIHELELSLKENPLDRKVKEELALFLIEPGHDPIKAAQLLTDVISENSDAYRAKLWLSFIYVYSLMQEQDLWAAIRLCDDIAARSTDQNDRAAAVMLKASAIRQLDPTCSVRNELEKSVKLAPSWVANRQFLAQVYFEDGHRERAKEQLQCALDNLRSEKTRSEHYGDKLFELLITGRDAHLVEDRIARQIKQVEG